MSEEINQQQESGTGNIPVGGEQKPPETTGQPDPEWLPGRLKRAKQERDKELLGELGLENWEAVKQLSKSEAERQEKAKSTEQKHTEEVTAHKATKKQLEALQTEFTAILDAEIEAIPESHRETAKNLLDIAGDDPVARMKVIRGLKPLFSSPAAPLKPKAPDLDGKAGTSGGKEQEYSKEEIDSMFRLRGGK